MKIRLFLFLFLALTFNIARADIFGSSGDITFDLFTDCHGSGKAVTFTAATNTFGCNTITASAAAGGGLNAVQYNDGAAIAGKEQTFSFNGTNVGIGTVNGTSTVEIRSPDGNNAFEILDVDDNYSAFSVGKNGSNSTVGIGTNSPDPTQTLVVSGPTTIHSGNISFRMVGAANTWYVYNASGNVQFAVESATLGNTIRLGDGVSGIPAAPVGRNNVMVGRSFAATNKEVVNFNSVATTFSPTGSYDTQRYNVFEQLTVSGAVNVSNGSTVDIIGGNISAGGATLPYNAALRVEKDNVLFGATGTTNVGIGTIDPLQALQVVGTAQMTGFKLTTNPGAGYVLVGTSVGAGTWMPASTLPINGGSATPAGGLNAVQVNRPLASLGGEELVLSQNGTNVGIGTTNARELFEVAGGNVGIGTFLNKSTLGVKGGVAVGAAYGDKTALTGDIVTTNNVGIGTWAPTKALCVGSTCQGSVDSSGNGILGGTLAVTGHVTVEAVTSTGATGTGKFVFDGTPTLVTPVLGVATATSVNKVAITAPATSATLTIADSKTLAATQTVSLDTMTDGKWCSYSSSGTSLHCDNNTPAGSSQFSTQSPIGIGTTEPVAIGTYTPSSFLTVLGNVGIGTIKNDAYVTQATTNGNLVVQGNVGIGTWKATNSLVIMSNAAGAGNGGGNIGIGTLSPGVSLDVNGVVRLSGSGDSYFGGNVGIGTQIPMGNLAVQGSIVQGTVANTGSIVDTNVVFFGGNVGIGTKVPYSILAITGGNVGIGTNFAQNGLSLMSGQNIGIGTIAPADALIISRGNVGIGTNSPQSALTLGSNNHLGSTGTAPTVANNDCGTTAQGTIVAGSTDMRGQVTVGTLTVTSCAVTFNKAFGVAPICITQDDTNILGVKNTQTTTKLTITSTTSMSSDVVSWVCIE